MSSLSELQNVNLFISSSLRKVKMMEIVVINIDNRVKIRSWVKSYKKTRIEMTFSKPPGGELIQDAPPVTIGMPGYK